MLVDQLRQAGFRSRQRRRKAVGAMHRRLVEDHLLAVRADGDLDLRGERRGAE
jgi:hypothetical protein